MLREHYCGSLTFREQRNAIENLCQKPQEAAIDFLIRVGTSVSNLGKDWKGRLTQEELSSLQHEISLNGVNEQIRHVLDSETARQGQLTPQQMYEVVKKYETYLAVIREWRVRALAPPPVNQEPLVIPLAINLGSIKPQLLLLLLGSLRMIHIILLNLLLWRRPTPLELSPLKRTTRDYTSPVTSRMSYRMTPFCR